MLVAAQKAHRSLTGTLDAAKSSANHDDGESEIRPRRDWFEREWTEDTVIISNNDATSCN
jgi:hypothetical protein